jgi:hypothetical protein
MPELIDLEAIPEAPPGSDADRIGRGLPPLGDDRPYQPARAGGTGVKEPLAAPPLSAANESSPTEDSPTEDNTAQAERGERANRPLAQSIPQSELGLPEPPDFK